MYTRAAFFWFCYTSRFANIAKELQIFTPSIFIQMKRNFPYSANLISLDVCTELLILIHVPKCGSEFFFAISQRKEYEVKFKLEIFRSASDVRYYKFSSFLSYQLQDAIYKYCWVFSLTDKFSPELKTEIFRSFVV